MNTTSDRDGQYLALLLDVPEEGSERDAVLRRLDEDPAFRARFLELQEMGDTLAALGASIHKNVGGIDIVDAVQDSVTQLNWEALTGEQRPFYALEQDLESAARAWHEDIAEVDLVACVLDAAKASHQSEREIELPYGPLTGALNTLGSEMANATPTVDLVAGIMLKIGSPASRHPEVVPLRPRGAAASTVSMPQKRRPVLYGSWAAAAVLCLAGAWLTYHYMDEDSPTNLVAQHPQNPSIPLPDGGQDDLTGLTRVIPFDELPEATVPDEGDLEGRPNNMGGAEAITVQDAINARRRALVNDAATFQRLASLSADEASSLLQDLDISMDALIGAAKFLPPEEAAAVLRAALVTDPENESLRYALAQALSGDPALSAERQANLENLIALNGNNSLPHYMLAADYMARGESGSAMSALANGATQSAARPYTLESMRQYEAALEASGLDAEVAQYLAVATAGQSEVADIAALRSELLGYGAYYAEQGDNETAEQIYNAVNQLGIQITDGAEMAIVQQAGLETQQDALSAIQGIAEILQKPENVALLGDGINVLAESIFDVSQYVTSAQDVVNNPQATSTDWSQLIQHIMANGDMNIANLLGS